MVFGCQLKDDPMIFILLFCHVGYLLATTKLLGCLTYIALVEILNNIQHFKGIKKAKQVLALVLAT